MGHRLLLCTVEPPEGYNSSLSVRMFVYHSLMSDDSFVEPEMTRTLLFCDPIADYFLIGGSWSGLLIGQENQTDQELGEDHDAQLVTWELYAEHLVEFEGFSLREIADCPVFVDLDEEEVNPDFVGRKYLIVVDYHS